MAIQLLYCLFLFSLLPPTSPASSFSAVISDAAQVLSDVGLVSMFLTLNYGHPTPIPITQNLTIFSPSDTAFRNSGQPSLSLLRFHFSPQSLPPSFLRSLPFGSKLPTFSPDYSLILTSSPSDDQISLNGVKIGKSFVHDYGSLIVYKLDEFFDPNFSLISHQGCIRSNAFRKSDTFDKAIDALRSNAYLATASFLDSQMERSNQNMMLTIFAPHDEMVKRFVGNWSVYQTIFLKLMVPREIRGRDMVNWNEDMVLDTCLEGFQITVVKSGGDLLVNGAKIKIRDLFQSEWLVVHGLGGGGSCAGGAARSGAVIGETKLNKILSAISSLLISIF